MKLGLAFTELHRTETALTRELLRVSDRHRAEHEVHHVARDLAGWSRDHVARLAEAARRHDLRLDPLIPETSGPPAPIHDALSEAADGWDEPGLALLADLRHLHRTAAGVSLDWELLAQGAQAVKDADALGLAASCHPRTLRQLTWANAMLKALAPQILAS